MEFTIRKAVETDYEAVLSLIKELAEFEKAPHKVTNSVEQMKQEQDLFNCYVVEIDSGEIVAMALYFFAYYTWVGKSLYVDDIYVKQAYRRNKIATKLLNILFEQARLENCKRVRWQVLEWNEAAITLYKNCKADIDPEWLNCDFDIEGIKNFNI